MYYKIKNFLITFIISSFLFAFIFFLIYIIYCYGYYNKNQKEVYINNFYEDKYDFIYDNFKKNNNPRDSYYKVINFINNKNYLINIYNNYYQKTNISLDEFLNKYYYSKQDSLKADITFEEEGYTSLFKRKKIYYKDIIIRNEYNQITISFINNLNIITPNEGFLYLDDIKLNCQKNTCNIKDIFTGLHEVKYYIDDNMYYKLINIKDNKDIKLDLKEMNLIS